MGKCFLFGNGGAVSFNYAVKAYASFDDLPETAKWNTIAIETGVAITSYIFCNAEPAEPVEGMVLLRTADSGSISINALKKNGLIIFLASAHQYINGAWEDKPMKVYQGAWLETIPYLYNLGDECESLTGGWKARAWAKDGSSVSAKAPTLTRGEDYIQASIGSGSGVMETTQDVDLTPYATLYLDYESFLGSGTANRYANLAVTKRSGASYNTAAYATKGLSTSTSGRVITSVDISEVNQAADIAIHIQSAASASLNVKMYLMWME